MPLVAGKPFTGKSKEIVDQTVGLEHKSNQGVVPLFRKERGSSFLGTNKK